MSIPKSVPPSMAIHNALAAQGNARVAAGKQIMRRATRQIVHNHVTIIQQPMSDKTGPWERGSAKGW